MGKKEEIKGAERWVNLMDLSPKDFDTLMARLSRIKNSCPLDNSGPIPTRLIPTEIDSVLKRASFLKLQRQIQARDKTPIQGDFTVDMTAVNNHPVK